MDNKKIIQRLLSFDDDEGPDNTSTGFNSVSGRGNIPDTETLCSELSEYMEISVRKQKYGSDLVDYYVYDEDTNTLILNDEDINGINTGYDKCYDVDVYVKDPKAVCGICRRYGGMRIEIPKCNIESQDTFSAERFVRDVLTGYTNRTGTGGRGEKMRIDLGLVRCQNRIPLVVSDDKFRNITVSLYMDDNYDGSPLVIGGSAVKPLQMEGYNSAYILAIDISLMDKSFPEGFMDMEKFFGKFGKIEYDENGRPYAPTSEAARLWNRAEIVNDIIPVNLDMVVQNANIKQLYIDNNDVIWNHKPVQFMDDNNKGVYWWKEAIGMNLSLYNSGIKLLKYDHNGIDILSIEGYQNITNLFYYNSFNERKFGGLPSTRAKSLIRDNNQRMKSPKQVTVR